MRATGAWCLVLAVAIAACGTKRAARKDAGVAREPAVDAAVDPEWRALDGMPRARARWSARVAIVDAGAEAIDVHGPLIHEGAAIVAGSRIGVAAVDLATRAVRFQRPVTGHVPLPAVLDGNLLAIGDCEGPAGEGVIGCYTVLDAHVEAVHGAGTIVGEATLEGPVTLALGERTAFYGDEETRVRFELPEPPRGEVRAEAVRPQAEKLRIGEGDERVDLWVKDDILELWYARPDVISDRIAVIDFAGAPGALGVAGDRDVRGFQKAEAGLQPVIVHVDGLAIDPLGAPLPGTLIAAAHGPRGFALAARLDADHAYVAALTTDGTLAWVSPLSAPTGIAMSDDAVVAFHDGATLAIFPLP